MCKESLKIYQKIQRVHKINYFYSEIRQYIIDISHKASPHNRTLTAFSSEPLEQVASLETQTVEIQVCGNSFLKYSHAQLAMMLLSGLSPSWH